MTFGICLLLAIWLLWVLLVQGALWKLIVAFFGWIGMFVALQAYFPASKHVCIVLSGHSFTWSQVIPTVIILLATFYTRD